MSKTKTVTNNTPLEKGEKKADLKIQMLIPAIALLWSFTNELPGALSVVCTTKRSKRIN